MNGETARQHSRSSTGGKACFPIFQYIALLPWKSHKNTEKVEAPSTFFGADLTNAAFCSAFITYQAKTVTPKIYPTAAEIDTLDYVHNLWLGTSTEALPSTLLYDEEYTATDFSEGEAVVSTPTSALYEPPVTPKIRKESTNLLDTFVHITKSEESMEQNDQDALAAYTRRYDLAIYAQSINTVVAYTGSLEPSSIEILFEETAEENRHYNATAMCWVKLIKSDLPYLLIGYESGSLRLYTRSGVCVFGGELQSEVKCIQLDEQDSLLLIVLGDNLLTILPISVLEQNCGKVFNSNYYSELLHGFTYFVASVGIINNVFLTKNKFSGVTVFNFLPCIKSICYNEDAEDKRPRDPYISLLKDKFASTSRSSTRTSQNSFLARHSAALKDVALFATKKSESLFNPDLYNAAPSVTDERYIILAGESPPFSIRSLSSVVNWKWFLEANETRSGTEQRNPKNPFVKEVQASTFWELNRIVISLSSCPWNPNLILLLDNLGQIEVVSCDSLSTIHSWKGYKDSEVGWLQYDTKTTEFPVAAPRSYGGILIYSQRRCLMELWDLSVMQRMFAFTVTESGRLLMDNGHAYFVTESRKIYEIKWVMCL